MSAGYLANYLLDTGIANLIALEEPTILRRLMSAQSAYVPEIVFGELYFGAYIYAHKHNSTKLLDRCDAFRQRYAMQVLQCDLDTAQTYGTIAAELRIRGQPMQSNDMWIAALARQHGLTLATRDSDFARVPRISIELW